MQPRSLDSISSEDIFFATNVTSDIKLAVGLELDQNGLGNQSRHELDTQGFGFRSTLNYVGGAEEIFNLDTRFAEPNRERLITVELRPAREDTSQLSLSRHIRRAESVFVRDITESRVIKENRLEVKKKFEYLQMEQEGEPVVEVRPGQVYVTRYLTERPKYKGGKYDGDEIEYYPDGAFYVHPNAYVYSQDDEGVWKKSLIYVSKKTGRSIFPSEQDHPGYDLMNLPVTMDEIDEIEQFTSKHSRALRDPDRNLVNFVGQEILRENNQLETD